MINKAIAMLFIAAINATKIKEIDFDPAVDDTYLADDGTDLRKSNAEYQSVDTASES